MSEEFKAALAEMCTKLPHRPALTPEEDAALWIQQEEQMDLDAMRASQSYAQWNLTSLLQVERYLRRLLKETPLRRERVRQVIDLMQDYFSWQRWLREEYGLSCELALLAGQDQAQLFEASSRELEQIKAQHGL